MFGEEIGGGQGKRTGRRVIGTEPLKVEASFEESTNLMGMEGVNIGTYVATTKPDGSLLGSAKAFMRRRPARWPRGKRSARAASVRTAACDTAGL